MSIDHEVELQELEMRLEALERENNHLKQIARGADILTRMANSLASEIERATREGVQLA